MKNMRVAKKLALGFLIASLLTAIVGAVGIIGMLRINDGGTLMYDTNTVPITYMSKVIESMQRIRVNVRQYIVSIIDDELSTDEGIQAVYEKIEDYKTDIETNLSLFEATIVNPEVGALFERASKLYENDYMAHLERAYNLALAGDTMGIVHEIDSSTAFINDIVSDLDSCMQLKVANAAKASAEGDAMFTRMLMIIIGVMAFSIGISVFLATYISGLIAKPLARLSAFMKKAGSTGDITVTPEDNRILVDLGNVRDEIGQTISSAKAFVDHVVNVSHELENVAKGDLTVDIKMLSDADVMGHSLMQMVDNLNDMFGNINSSTAQVSYGAKQVSDGAQSLAQGSTEQAASIEELSSSIAEIAAKTKENAMVADKTAKLSDAIKESAEKGSRQMDEMISAVKEINSASHSISNIIKTIDDIAFQTNILALNAAVEAARAGQHGKGFAVVAEEVRNLASKSADAAKDTSDMIQNSIEKAQLGTHIAEETATSLKDIVTGINESNILVAEIAKASEEQSIGISQVNAGIDQVAQVVQQNSATAQQSAAASEEMNSQSSVLQELIQQFKLRNDGVSYNRALPVAARLGIEH